MPDSTPWSVVQDTVEFSRLAASDQEHDCNRSLWIRAWSLCSRLARPEPWATGQAGCHWSKGAKVSINCFSCASNAALAGQLTKASAIRRARTESATDIVTDADISQSWLPCGLASTVDHRTQRPPSSSNTLRAEVRCKSIQPRWRVDR